MTSNSADEAGGGVFWNYNQPYPISNVTFSSNTATNYGNDKACFAQKMIRIEESVYTSYQSRRALSNNATLSGTDSITVIL
jgi:hypothetical protein